jgi:hypothetical protein
MNDIYVSCESHVFDFPLLWAHKVFYVNGECLDIPDDYLIKEATIPQPLDREFACRILEHYEIADNKKVLKILEKNSDNIWNELCSELGKLELYDPKIYAFFSLQKNRTIQKSPLKSLNVFREYSNDVVSCFPTEVDQVLVQHCKLNGLNHSMLNYYKGLRSWCYAVFPQPLKHKSSIEMEYKRREIQERGFIEDIENGVSTFDNLPKGLMRYMEGIVETVRRSSIRFSYINAARLTIESIDRDFALLQDSGKSKLCEYHASKFNKNYENVTKHKANSIRPRSPIILSGYKLAPLLQCQFCYAYRVEEQTSRSPSSTSWHCQSQDCTKAYKRWQKDLSRKGLTLEKLRESGF